MKAQAEINTRMITLIHALFQVCTADLVHKDARSQAALHAHTAATLRVAVSDGPIVLFKLA